MREGQPWNPPGGYEEFKDPTQRHLFSSLLAKHLQLRLTAGGDLSDIVDLELPTAASNNDDGMDAGIAHISKKTAVRVKLSIGGIDGHEVWCMPGAAHNNMPAPHSSGAAAVVFSGSACPSKPDTVRTSTRKRFSGSSGVNLGKLELEAFEGLCQKFEMFREPVPGDGNCMPSSAAQGMLWQDHISRGESGQLRTTDRELRSKTIRKEAVKYAVDHAADFQSFFVSDPKSRGDTGPQDGVRGKSPMDWSGPMLKSGTYGDDLLLQCIAFHLKKDIQVFSFHKDTKTMRMKTIYGVIRSKEDSAKLESTDLLPTGSHFEDKTVLRLTHLQHQHGVQAHYDCLIANQVCERSLGACPLPGNQFVRIFS